MVGIGGDLHNRSGNNHNAAVGDSTSSSSSIAGVPPRQSLDNNTNSGLILDDMNTNTADHNNMELGSNLPGSPKYHGSTGLVRTFNVMTDNQKQGILLLVLSAVIYVACQFDATFTYLIPQKAALLQAEEEEMDGPPPGTNIQMIALLGERNSGTRWTSSHLVDCFNDTIEVSEPHEILKQKMRKKGIRCIVIICANLF